MRSLITYSVVCLVASFSAAAGEPPAKTPALLEKGKVSFTTNCLACHGAKGDGLGDAGKYMNPKPRNFLADKFKKGEKVADVFNSVTRGLDGTAMPGYGTLPEEERWALAYYVLTFRDKK